MKLENTPAQVNMAPEDGKALIAFLLSRQKTLITARDSAMAAVGSSSSAARRGQSTACLALVTPFQ